MDETYAQWRSGRPGITFDRQRAHSDGAKLLCTVAAGLAGSFIASALQTTDDSPADAPLEIAAACVLVIAFGLILRVIHRDFIVVPDVVAIANDPTLTRPDARLSKLREREFAAEADNEHVVMEVQQAARWQLVASAVAALLATASLLIR